VAIGDTWKIPNDVAQALCNFEGLTSQDLTCKLEEVNDNKARVVLVGTTNGIDLGALVKLNVTGTYSFDLRTQSDRVTGVETEGRTGAGAGEPCDGRSKSLTQLTRTSIEQPANLSDVALISVPDGLDPPAGRGSTDLPQRPQDPV